MTPFLKKLIGVLFLLGGLGLIVLAEHFDNPPALAKQGIVIASEKVTHTEIAGSVILIISQTKNSSWGLRLDLPSPDGEFFYGGAVERDEWIHALHSLDVVFPDTKVMKSNNLGLLQGAAAIESLKTAARKPAWFRIYKGYAGWGRRQLNDDLESGLWYLVPYDEKFVKETPPDKMWKTALALPRIMVKN